MIFMKINDVARHLFVLVSAFTIACSFGNYEYEPSRGYRYTLSIAACFQNEALFLKEWIEFHRLVGVQHFYLYNNLSTDNYQNILAPYVRAGIVELYNWPRYAQNWVSLQGDIYTAALNQARGKTEWLAIIDLDEFLVPVRGNNLISILQDYRAFGGVGVNWQMYGTSNIQKIPAGQLQIEALLHKAHTHDEVNKHIKSIVRPDCVLRCDHPHFVVYKQGYFQVNTHKQHFQGPFTPVSIDVLRINHYWTRDEDYFHRVKLPRRARVESNVQKWIPVVKTYNAEYDPTMLRFAHALHRQMDINKDIIIPLASLINQQTS